MPHTEKELRQLQELPLNEKIRMTRMRIQQWVSAYGINGVHISFSGGKDSTVLLDIARRDHPNIQAVFFDTGLEYPEIREFVKSYDNVVWLKPKMNFRQVIEKYGYPFISKEVAENVAQSRNGLRKKGEDYQSTRLQRLRGDFNYYVMPRKVYEAVKDMLPYGVGVYVTDEDCRLALYSVKQARRKSRTRPVSEMLLMMFRSAARERGRK